MSFSDPTDDDDEEEDKLISSVSMLFLLRLSNIPSFLLGPSFFLFSFSSTSSSYLVFTFQLLPIWNFPLQKLSHHNDRSSLVVVDCSLSGCHTEDYLSMTLCYVVPRGVRTSPCVIQSFLGLWSHHETSDRCIINLRTT